MWSKSTVLNLLKKCYILSSSVTNHHWKHLATSLLGFEKLLTPKWMVVDAFVRSWHFAFNIYNMDCFTGINSGHSTKWAIKNTPIRLSHPKKFGTIMVCILKKPLRRTTHYFMPDQSWFINCIPTCGTQTPYFLGEKRHSLLRNGERLKKNHVTICVLFLFLTMVHGDLKVPWSMKPSKAGWNVHHPAPSQCLHVCPGHGQSRHQGSTWESAGLNKKLPCLNYQDTILNHAIEKSNIYIYVYIHVYIHIYT